MILGFSSLHGFLLIAFYRLNLQKLLKFAILMSLIPLVLFPRKMESSILTQMSLCLILFYFNTGALCSVEDFHYRKINEIRDKIPVDEAIFSSVNSSPIRCVQRCIRSPNCMSVFLSGDFLCRGYSVMYEKDSPNLTAKIGASCYAVHVLEGLYILILKNYAL